MTTIPYSLARDLDLMTRLEDIPGVTVLPDCKHRGPFDLAVGGQECNRWQGHPGAHTWHSEDMSIQLRWWDGWEIP